MTNSGEFVTNQARDMLSSRSYDTVASAIEALLVAADSELLWADEDEDGQETGWQRHLKVVDPDIPSASLIVAIYREDKRDVQAELLRLAGIKLVRPIGSLQFSLTRGGASVNGTLYLDDDRRIKGRLDCSIPNIEELLCEDSEKLYDFMEAMGLGRVYVKGFLFPGEARQAIDLELDDRMAGNLAHFLAAQQEQRPSQ